MDNNSEHAFGAPGLEPRWTHANKEGVGTAYAPSTRVWYTLWNGHLTEIYYPTVDRPQVRDLLYLVTDGKNFLHSEQNIAGNKTLTSLTERIGASLGYTVQLRDLKGRYAIEKTIIADPHLPCVLQHTKLSGDDSFLNQLKLYVLCAPHMEVGGWGNNGHVVELSGQHILVAHKNGRWLALGATCPFSRLSVGYVGASDGWTDLSDNFQMDYAFRSATDGNIALTGEIDIVQYKEFTVGLAFGETRHSAMTTLMDALFVPFDAQAKRFAEQWQRPVERRIPLENASCDGGDLYRSSYIVLLAHEDKTYPGALIASLAIPWGEAKADEEGKGGYHLVWTRDMVQSAVGLLAAGNTATPLRALMYLAASQQSDGNFSQNFWVDGTPSSIGIQLDEVAFPVLLTRQLHYCNALSDFNPCEMVLRAIRFLVTQGPSTQQERWEEARGYSPSTLAINIVAFLCAAAFAHENAYHDDAHFLEEYADWMRDHLEEWTVTNQGTLLPEVKRHFVRINPINPGQAAEAGSLDSAELTLTSQSPEAQSRYPAREIVDAGFLELVRYGILAPNDPLVIDSLKVVDATLKVDTPGGVSWQRYNHDGYGQRQDGSAYINWGQGRAWPLLTGERGHYELAAGHDPTPYIQAMEALATNTGLLPEQVWDQEDLLDSHMFRGKPTGSATPLAWAHAEYIKLLRSTRDGKVFDRIPEVADRYLSAEYQPKPLEIWGFMYPLTLIPREKTLRIIADASFRLRWSNDDWQTEQDTDSVSTSIGISFVDILPGSKDQLSYRFNFYWPQTDNWEGRDFLVSVK